MEYILIIFMVFILFFFQCWCIANLIKDDDKLAINYKLLKGDVSYNEWRINELEEEIICLKETVDSLIQEVG